MKPTIITLGDLLKAEADARSRIHIAASSAVKIGQLIEHPERNEYLVTLSDAVNGQVLLQPHNCTINLDYVTESDITGKGLTVDEFIKQGDAHGIKYIGEPYSE